VKVEEETLPRKIGPTLRGRAVRCLLFDFGDTLWMRKDLPTWTRLEQEANEQAVVLLRSRLPSASLPALDDVTLGNEVRKAVERQIRDAKRRNPEYEPNFAEMAAHGLRQLGIVEADLQLGEDVYEALRVPILTSRIVYPDVFATLAQLRKRGFALGVVTNRHWGGAPFMADLRAMGFLDYFPSNAIAISADLGVRKPNPAIFWPALNALGAVPSEAAMIGDSLSADIVGARRMGIYAIWKPKPYLYAEAEALRRAAQPLLQQQMSTLRSLYLDAQEEQQPQISQLPPDLESTDEDYLLEYAISRESKRKQRLQQEMRPDLIIEHASDLLEVFIEPASLSVQ
jgi:FMN phosphatase YigB (HAD superfamily)